jgi:hypothetical protein
MSLLSSIITDIQYQIEDTSDTRFSAAYKLNIVKLAIRRANRIVQRNGIQFAKKYADLTTTASTAYVNMPADFDVDIGLWNTGTNYSLIKLAEDVWEELVNPEENQFYCLDYVNSRILIANTPQDSTTTLRLWYYPTVDPSAYTTASTMPWGGRLDDVITQYAVMRFMNIAEMDASMELQLLQDMEAQILESYKPLTQTLQEKKGWLIDG